MPANLAVLVSGSGTILEAIMNEGLPLRLVAADRPCRGLDIAAAAGLPTELVARTDFSRRFDRTAYTLSLVECLERHQVDFLAMAGFMTVLAAPIFERFAGRILNTHPSLLPLFRGAHAVRDTLASGTVVTGCTVHVATLDLDAGPVLAQATVPILPTDTEQTLHERIKQVERRLYPSVLKRVLSGELVLAQQ